MQWEKAKNLMLVFLLLANLLLAALIRYENDSHTLSRERENAILTVFYQNNINMYREIPRNFAPMRALQVSAYDYNMDRLLGIFFPSYAEITHNSSTDWDEFTWDSRRLVISNGYIAFSSGRGVTGVPDRDAAIAITQNFIREHYPDFRLDVQSTRYARRGGLRIFYRQEYQGHLIHTNFVEFLVTGEGDMPVIEEVDIQYGRPLGFAYLPRELAGPDEALLTFVQNIRRRYEPVLITHMDIVYFQMTPGRRDTYTTFYAEPFYRIFIEGQDDPFLINAYTNRMLGV